MGCLVPQKRPGDASSPRRTLSCPSSLPHHAGVGAAALQGWPERSARWAGPHPGDSRVLSLGGRWGHVASGILGQFRGAAPGRLMWDSPLSGTRGRHDLGPSSLSVGCGQLPSGTANGLSTCGLWEPFHLEISHCSPTWGRGAGNSDSALRAFRGPTALLAVVPSARDFWGEGARGRGSGSRAAGFSEARFSDAGPGAAQPGLRAARAVTYFPLFIRRAQPPSAAKRGSKCPQGKGRTNDSAIGVSAPNAGRCVIAGGGSPAAQVPAEQPRRRLALGSSGTRESVWAV